MLSRTSAKMLGCWSAGTFSIHMPQSAWANLRSTSAWYSLKWSVAYSSTFCLSSSNSSELSKAPSILFKRNAYNGKEAPRIPPSIRYTWPFTVASVAAYASSNRSKAPAYSARLSSAFAQARYVASIASFFAFTRFFFNCSVWPIKYFQ